MRKSYIIPLILCLFLMASCGKSITEEAEQEEAEQPVTPPDDGGGDDGNDDGGGSDDGGSGGGSDDGGGNGGNNGDDGGGVNIETGSVVTVSQFLTLTNLPMVYVQGSVVGACSGSMNSPEMEPPFTKSTSILLADDISETDKTKMVPVKRPTSKNVGIDLNLVTNPELWHKKIKVPGYQEAYYGTVGIKDVRGLCYIFDE